MKPRVSRPGRPTVILSAFLALSAAHPLPAATFVPEVKGPADSAPLSDLLDPESLARPDYVPGQIADPAAAPSDLPPPEVQQAIRLLARTGEQADVDRLRAALDDTRQSAGGWAYLAIWAADRGRMDLAREAGDRALALDPANTLVRLATAVLQTAAGDRAAALVTLTDLSRSAPRNLGVAVRLAELQSRGGDVRGAIGTLENLVTLLGPGPATAGPMLDLGRMYSEVQAHENALRHLSNYLMLPGQPAGPRELAAFLAAQAAFETGRTDTAQEYLSLQQDWPSLINRVVVLKAALEWEKAPSEQAERQLDALIDDPDAGPAARTYLARILFRKDQPVQGARLLEEAIARSDGLRRVQLVETLVSSLSAAGLDPEADAALRRHLEALGAVGHVMLTDRMLSQGRHAEAIEAATAGLARFPQESELLYLRGMAHFMMGRPDEARAGFEAATTLDPDHARAWISLAKLLHDKGGHGGVGRHTDVIAVYERALRLSPDNAIIEIELGKVAQEEGRPEASEEWYRKALAHAPGDPLADSLLAILLVEQDRLTEARRHADKAFETLPEHHLILFAKGRVALAAGQDDAAADLLLATNAARPEHGHSLAYAAVALDRAGRPEEAAATARKALYLALRDDEAALARGVLTRIDGARDLTVPIDRIDTEGVGERHGEMRLQDTPAGLRLRIALNGAKPGHNSVHLHETPSCAPAYRDEVLVAGLSAGEHLGMAQAGGGHAHGHEAPAAGGAMPPAAMGPMGPTVVEMTGDGAPMRMVLRTDGLPIGDLPMLMATDEGVAQMDVVVPYLHTSLLRNRSVIVHDGMAPRRAYCGIIGG